MAFEKYLLRLFRVGHKNTTLFITLKDNNLV